jgi:hypothetical protein
MFVLGNGRRRVSKIDSIGQMQKYDNWSLRAVAIRRAGPTIGMRWNCQTKTTSIATHDSTIMKLFSRYAVNLEIVVPLIITN